MRQERGEAKRNPAAGSKRFKNGRSLPRAPESLRQTQRRAQRNEDVTGRGYRSRRTELQKRPRRHVGSKRGEGSVACLDELGEIGRWAHPKALLACALHLSGGWVCWLGMRTHSAKTTNIKARQASMRTTQAAMGKQRQALPDVRSSSESLPRNGMLSEHCSASAHHPCRPSDSAQSNRGMTTDQRNIPVFAVASKHEASAFASNFGKEWRAIQGAVLVCKERRCVPPSGPHVRRRSAADSAHPDQRSMFGRHVFAHNAGLVFWHGVYLLAPWHDC